MSHPVLKEVRALLTDPTHWSKGAMAKDPWGGHLKNPKDPTASCWCLYGALLAQSTEQRTVLQAVGDLSAAYGSPDTHMNLIRFNDSHRTRHADVLALLDKAIGEPL